MKAITDGQTGGQVKGHPMVPVETLQESAELPNALRSDSGGGRKAMPVHGGRNVPTGSVGPLVISQPPETIHGFSE